MSAQSCNTDNGEMTLGIERDTTLAGSVSLTQIYYFTAECSYDGEILDGFTDYMSQISWGDTTIRLSVEDIPVSGKAGDVTFNFTTDSCAVSFNESGYESVSANVNGYIREIPITKDDPAAPNYDCAIDFQCEVDGKPLLLS